MDMKKTIDQSMKDLIDCQNRLKEAECDLLAAKQKLYELFENNQNRQKISKLSSKKEVIERLLIDSCPQELKVSDIIAETQYKYPTVRANLFVLKKEKKADSLRPGYWISTAKKG